MSKAAVAHIYTVSNTLMVKEGTAIALGGRSKRKGNAKFCRRALADVD